MATFPLVVFLCSCLLTVGSVPGSLGKNRHPLNDKPTDHKICTDKKIGYREDDTKGWGIGWLGRKSEGREGEEGKSAIGEGEEREERKDGGEEGVGSEGDGREMEEIEREGGKGEKKEMDSKERGRGERKGGESESEEREMLKKNKTYEGGGEGGRKRLKSEREEELGKEEKEREENAIERRREEREIGTIEGRVEKERKDGEERGGEGEGGEGEEEKEDMRREEVERERTYAEKKVEEREGEDKSIQGREGEGEEKERKEGEEKKRRGKGEGEGDESYMEKKQKNKKEGEEAGEESRILTRENTEKREKRERRERLGAIKIETLGLVLKRVDLKPFFLNKRSRSRVKFVTSSCDGGICPEFRPCLGRFSEKIDACWSTNMLGDEEKRGNESDERVAVGGQVYILNSIYVNIFGYPINTIFHFDRGGCAWDARSPAQLYNFQPETKVTVFKEFVNLAHWNGRNFYHFLVELLPALVEVIDILQKNPNIAVAYREGQYYTTKTVGSLVLGDQIKQLNYYEILPSELFLGKKVYQPYFAPCHRPNPVQWQFLRRNFFLPQDGFPIFNPDWTFRKPTNTVRDDEISVPSDWVAILGKRHGARELRQSDMVERTMIGLFGRKRVKVFDGNMSLSDAKILFNRALIFVTPHGALMANMLFMPKDGFIFEFRPTSYRADCYARLAQVCGHYFYFLWGRGGKHTSVSVNMELFLEQFNSMVETVKTIHPQLFSQ